MKTVVWFVVAVAASATLAFPVAASALNKKLTKRSYMDARHCLALPTSEAIIRCTERYM